MKLAIRNGRLIDPSRGIDEVGELQIVDGLVVARSSGFTPDEVIDAQGFVVCPGLVDLRARLREPGHEHKGTIESETLAAVAGGITTISCPPDTDPIIDSPAVAQMIQTRAWQTGRAFIHPLGALTRGLKGLQLADMAALDEAGCVGFTNALHPIQDTQVLRHALEYAAGFGLTVFLHAEDPWLRGKGVVHEGETSSRLGLPGIPEAAETAAIARDLVLIEQTGVRAHFCQISSLRGASMIAAAQAQGLPVTADVAVHQLHLSEQDVGFFDSHYHVRPPLRRAEDRDGLRQALARGTISTVCSDHQPHEADAKLAPFSHSESGISGLETLLPLTLALVTDGVLTLPAALAAITCNAAAILGVDAGHLDTGATADVCIFDPGAQWTLTAQGMLSRGRNTPFLGRTLQGKVVRTLVGGETVFTATR